MLLRFQRYKKCNNSPIYLSNPSEKREKKAGFKKNSGVDVRVVSLSKRYKSLKRNTAKPLDKEGKELTIVQVSGFIRHQPYGKGRMQYKDIWVDSFTRGQWVKTGLTYVTVEPQI